MQDACCVPRNINDLENTFDQKRAEDEACAYLEKGSDKRIKKLLAYFEGQSIKPFTVLDIGGGVGGAHFELLKNGLALSVVGVDASPSYIASARQIADSLKLTERVQYIQMDFAQSPVSIESADIVILDRVICCYPHLESLLAPAARRATRYLALSYPREDWWVRVFYRLTNGIRRLSSSEFFTYIHSHADVHRIALQNGLSPVHATRSGEWQITIFERNEFRED
jgi:SAM-dependent methyltransferase